MGISISRRAFITGTAASVTTASGIAAYALLPGSQKKQKDVDSFWAAYGQVIYEKNPGLEKRLYIFGQEHRFGGINSSDTTSLVQRDMYRLGEYLVKKKEVRIFVAEGINYNPFSREESVHKELVRMQIEREFSSGIVQKLDSMTDVQIHNILKSNFNSSSAPVLLSLAYETTPHKLILRGGDDKFFYDIAGFYIEKLIFGTEQKERDKVMQGLNYTSEARSAKMLQYAAKIVEEEQVSRKDLRPQACVSIGLAHIDEMIEFIEKDTAIIPAVDRMPSLDIPLNLTKTGFGVTIVKPNSLLDNYWKTIEEIAHLRCKPYPKAETMRITKPCA